MGAFGGTLWGGGATGQGGLVVYPSAQSVVEAAAILLGKIRPGQGLNTSELKDGFLWLCRMIASANANRANIFCEAINQYPTITGQQNYTLGANGIWNGARPMRITRANLLLPTSPTIRRHIEILTAAQWAPSDRSRLPDPSERPPLPHPGAAGRSPGTPSSSRARPQEGRGSSRSEERRVGKECRSRWSPY